jgi:hypothetical protein
MYLRVPDQITGKEHSGPFPEKKELERIRIYDAQGADVLGLQWASGEAHLVGSGIDPAVAT